MKLRQLDWVQAMSERREDHQGAGINKVRRDWSQRPHSRIERLQSRSHALSMLITSSCLALASLISIGCSDVVVDPGMAGEAMVSGSMAGDTGGSLFGGRTAGGMSAGATMNVTDACEYGENLGVCMICGPNLTPIKPLNDERCPYVPCETLTRYQAMPLEDGGRTCSQFIATPPVDSCKDLGVCYESPEEACTLSSTPTTLFTVYPGCGEFTGCDGEISPDASIKAEGEVCHSIGTCDAEGRCSAPASCSGDKPEYVVNHCPGPDSEEGCDLLIDMNGVPNANDISCTLACATQNGCITGWDSNNSCDRGGEIGCSTRRRQLICRCRGA